MSFFAHAPHFSSSTSSRASIPSAISIPRRESTADSTDTTPSAYSAGVSTHSGYSTPAYGPYSATTDMLGGSSGVHTPGGYFPHSGPIEIALDSEHLVMRGQGGDMNPAYLSGRIELNLVEATNIREITMNLTCKAKVAFTDTAGSSSKSHHHSHQIMSHDWSFLEGDKRHTHTLKAGHHSFPFSLMLDGSLPSSVHTYTSDGIITYKLRATVIRAGFATSNFHTSKTFTLDRTYTDDALEFSQTMEIENTWPGKVMYCLTLPYKAFAAGDEIPVNVKFMPLAKGVRVTAVTSVIKEYSLVHTRHSSHPESRVAACVKHELRDGRAHLIAEEPTRPPFHHQMSTTSMSSRTQSLAASRPPSPSRTAYAPRPADSFFPGQPSSNAEAGPSEPAPEPEWEDEQVGDDEIDTSLVVPIPAWTTPSHTVHPVFVTHKIKWSCSISNPDGHVSELRCALPIIILENRLLDEARAAGATTRGLLFGGAAADEAQQIDLPSYNNHVYDRVAVADSGNATGFLPRSAQQTPIASPSEQTPPTSRPISRPSSRPSSPRPSIDAGGLPIDEVPPRRELDQWADSELLLSLGALRVHQDSSPSASGSGTPALSRGTSRPLSRQHSRSGRSSRVGSRASSPERTSAPSSYNGDRPNPERRGTGGLGHLLHLPSSFKGIKPLTGHHGKPILRNSSAANLTGMSSNNASSEVLGRGSVSFSNVPERGHVSFRGEDHPEAGISRRGSHVDLTERDSGARGALSQVPSYDIASRGFLGGGVVPLDRGLPTYDVSEMAVRTTTPGEEVPRVRSDTALVMLGAEAAAAAEGRA